MHTYAHMLSLFNHLRAPIIHSAIQALGLPAGSRGLDAGCGIGSHTLLLAEAVAPGGHVTGLDLSPELLAHARRAAEQSPLSEQVTFKEGDVNALIFDDDTFDWVWSVDCIGYPTGSLSALEELARVVKPGGSVAILGWSSQQVLPGYPQLEARLNAASWAIAPYYQGIGPEQYFPRALGLLRDVGFEELTTHTFAGDVHAPLSDDVRSALVSLFEMLWAWAQSGIAPEDWAEYERLCLPESPDFILNLPDYYAFFTYSLFRGRAAR
jgi:ubiquinone/menaquinone biosynthesis C-methylase UbiE